MKLSRLFVLGTFGLMSLSAGAEVTFNDRTAPDFSVVEETPVAFEVGKNYLLYNTGAGMYFTQGSTWATRGCVVPNKTSAVLVRVAKYTLNDVWDGKTYEIENYITPRTGSYSWYKMCMNSAGDLYLDQTTWSRFVELKDQGSNVYRIMPSEENNNVTGDNGGVVSNGSQFVGYAGLAWDGGGTQYDFGKGDNEDRLPLSGLTDQNVDWVFYSTAAYDAAVYLFNKAEELKALINQADAAGVDPATINEAVAVYNNTSSTLPQIEAQIEAVGKAIAERSGITITGTPENPGDATKVITNPNFENASNEGWLGTAPNMVGSGSHGPADVAEHYNKTFDTYQNIYGLPSGVYGLSVSAFYRGQWEDYQNGTNRNAYLYATVGEDTQKRPFANPWEAQNTKPMAGSTEFGTTAGETSHTEGDVTYYIPNDPSAGRLYFEKGYYFDAVAFGVTGGSATIGVKKEVAVSNDWSVFDTFGLKYYGNKGEDSYKAWLKDNAKMLYATNMMATPGYVAQFEATFANKAPADAAAANAAFEEASKTAELQTLKLNQALWGKWLAALDEAVQYTTGDYAALSSAKTLDEYIGWDAAEQKNNPTWANNEIEASIALIAQMVEDVKTEKMNNIGAGEDVTNLYIGKDDAEFASGKGGWTLEGNCNFGSGGAEAYNQEFDLYKEIASVNAAGVYELQLQGFFRLERDDKAYNMYLNGEQDKTRAWIYMNDVKSYVGCVYDEKVIDGTFANGDAAGDGYWTHEDNGTTYYYPNTMGSAEECFNHDMYKVKAYGLVANAGDPLRIGIAGNMKGANWMMWDKFKLTFLGYDAATISSILQEALANMPALTEPMGKSVYAKATTVKAAAETAVYGSDGKAMFNALKDLWDVEAEIENSVALFKKLSAAREELNAMLGQSENADAVDEAGEFVEQLAADIKDHKYEDADVEGLLAKIKGFRYKLRMPAVITEGTDLTDVLETPTYTNANGEASSEGWEGTTAAVNSDVMNAEIFGGTTEPYNLFDHYQEIPGLPEGNYTVTVKAYYRAGDPKPDYEAYTAGTEGCDNVVLYANGVSTKIHRLAEFADGMHAGEDGWAEVAENSGLYVPNTMATAATLFDEQGNALVNKVVAKVGKDGILRLGLKKEVGIEKDWCLFDDWTLTCGGQLSGKPGDVNGDNVVDVADISAIISVMAGSEVNKATADVNGDGEVDVADISATITIMANNARAAKAIEE